MMRYPDLPDLKPDLADFEGVSRFQGMGDERR